MQTLKRTIIFLTCFVVLLSSFCFGSFAVDVEYNPYTGEEMIYDAEEGCYYSLYKPLDFEPISTYRVTTPNFPDFDINKLPWLEMPSYVQEIINATPIGLTNYSSYSGEYKLPFVSIVVAGSYIAINVGYNLCVGAYYQNAEQKENLEAYRYYLIANKSHSQLYANAVCYYAVYNRLTYQIRDAWTAVEPVAVGDNFVRYYNYNYTDTVKDSYFYGSSGMYAGRILETMKITSTDTDSYPQYVTVNNPSSGFASGTIMYAPDSWGGYIGTFTPPSAEALQQATSKGILETLKQIPTNIANAIQSFFTSLGDRIGDFFTSLKNYLLYFQETKPEHVNPFSDILIDIQTFFDKHMSDVTEFKNSLTSTLNNVVTYIESGSGVVNTFLTAVPVLSSFVTFFVVFCIVRKVIGR